jgi:MT-A70
MAESVLYQNASKSITVLDVPRSIAQGQGTSASLYSTPGPDVPYPSTEPKGAKREKLLSEIPEVERAYHHGIYKVLLSSLQEARIGIGDRDWCYQRLQQIKPGGTPQLTIDNSELSSRAINPPLFLSGIEDRLLDFNVLRSSLVVNPLHSNTTMAVNADVFHVPSCSTFICSTVAGGMPLFRLAMNSKLLFTGSTGHVPDFDLILLDPPWANRSVRNAKAYNTAESQDDPFDEVLPILQLHVAPEGIIAIWITVG